MREGLGFIQRVLFHLDGSLCAGLFRFELFSVGDIEL